MITQITIPITIIVDFTHQKAQKGSRNSLGVPEEPDDSENFEINSIKLNPTEQENNDILNYLFITYGGYNGCDNNTNDPL